MKWSRILWLLLAISVYQKAQAQTATVTWTTMHQTMDGFGGQTWIYADSLTLTQAAKFFSPSPGIGLQFVRTANTYDGSIPDLITLRNAGALGAAIELGLQSPPCTLKHSYVDLNEPCSDPSFASGAFYDGTAGTSGSCFANGSLPAAYSTWATYIVNYVNVLSAATGYPVTYLDVQNESGITKSALGACILTAANYDTFIGTYLGPALAAASWNGAQKASPKIMMASYEDWFQYNGIVSACLNDSTCAPYVSIVAGHSPSTYVPTAFAIPKSMHIWASEIDAPSGSYDSSCSGSGLQLATSVHNYLVNANVSGYEWWELAYPSTNSGLTDSSFNTSCRFWMQGNWSKFISPGWVRVDTTTNPQNGVYVTAFKSPDESSYSIVAINKSSSAISQAFKLGEFPASDEVIPWVTSSTLNLMAQPSVEVASDSFSFSLPAESVTTFVGKTNGGSAGSHVAPPSGLVTSVN
jgi:O-glycosyl hydrolase